MLHEITGTGGDRKAHHGGFTQVELLITFAVLGVLAGILVPLMSAGGSTSRQLADAAQIRRVHEGMILWANSSSDVYPHPFEVDRGNTTLRSTDVKMLTRHVVSILVYNGYVTPDELISPAETNPKQRVDTRYQYSAPAAAAAADKRLAAWDPAFVALNFEGTSGRPGSLSYALMPPAGARRALWTSSARGSQAIVGNRGPAYTATGSGAGLTWTLLSSTSNPGGGPTPVGTTSNTLRIHGSPNSWEGNIAYNDNHVEFETRPDPERVLFTFSSLPPGQQEQTDNVFANENDMTRAAMAETLTTQLGATDGAQTNNILRSWGGAATALSSGDLLRIEPWYD